MKHIVTSALEIVTLEMLCEFVSKTMYQAKTLDMPYNLLADHIVKALMEERYLSIITIEKNP